jgi:hypothetical protein
MEKQPEKSNLDQEKEEEEGGKIHSSSSSSSSSLLQKEPKEDDKEREKPTSRKRNHSEISPPASDTAIVTIQCSEIYPPSDSIITIQLVSSPCECKRPAKAPKIMSIALEGAKKENKGKR